MQVLYLTDFRFLVIVFLLNLHVLNLRAQATADSLIEDMIEKTAESAGNEIDYSELSERLHYYTRQPLNVNTATEEELRELLILSPLQIESFLTYRKQNGAFLQLEELQAVPLFNQQTIESILPMIGVPGAKPRLPGVNSKHKTMLMLTYGRTLEKAQGYVRPANGGTPYYQGSPSKLLLRYRHSWGENLHAAFTAEKDPGEGFIKGRAAQGFDFYSGNLFYKSNSVLSKAVLGDYNLQFGQGLGLWTGMSFSKGGAIVNTVKQPLGLKPYASTNEALFLRGAAATISLGRLDISPFVSLRFLDARIKSVDSASSAKIITVQRSGLHRSISELNSKNAAHEYLFGLNAQYSTNSFRTGATIYQTLFSHSFAPEKQLYKKYEFASFSILNASLYYSGTYRNLYLFGEAAHSLKSGLAGIQGLLLSMNKYISTSVIYRDYQKNYYSFYTQAMAESSAPSAERGLYVGLLINPSRKTEIALYADLFRLTWLKYRIDALSSGYSFSSDFNWKPSKVTQLHLQYRCRNKAQNGEQISKTLHRIELTQKASYRAELRYGLNRDVRLKSRVELSRYAKAAVTSSGFMVCQDLEFKPMGGKFSGNCRAAYFSTDDYNSRIYAYENDVLYSYSVPAFQKQGIRCYLNGRFRINNSIDLWARYAITNYINQNTIGSGHDMIAGRHKQDVKLQLRIQI